MVANIFQTKRRSSKRRKLQPNGWGTDQPPREYKYEILDAFKKAPSPCGATVTTYKICHIKWWLNHFWSLQETILLTKLLVLEVLWRYLILWLIFTVVSLLNSEILLFSWRKDCGKNPFFPSFSPLIPPKINLLFIPLYLIKLLYFPSFPFFPS